MISSSAARHTSPAVTPSPMPPTVTRDESSRPMDTDAGRRPPAPRRPAPRAPRRPPSTDRTRCRARPPSVAPSSAHRPSRTCQPTVTPPCASRATPSAGKPAGTVRTSASAVPHESSWSPGPAASAPTVAAWWSWPAVVRTAPASRGTPGVRRHPAQRGAGGDQRREQALGRAGPVEGLGPPAARRPGPASRCARPARRRSPRSPPRPRTTHSATLSRRTASAAAGSLSRCQRCLVSDHCERNGRPVRALNALGTEVAAEVGDLGEVAGVVPGDDRRDGSAAGIEQHARLGHARDAEAGHPPGRCVRQRARRRR